MNRSAAMGCLLGLVLLAACQTTRPLPPVNLGAPGWTLRHGQAVWHVPQGKTEIAGEVLLATRADGEAYAQFTKAALPLVIAQSAPGRWEVTFPPQNKHYAGRGAPPQRLLWLYLPRAAAGGSLPKSWLWRSDARGWKLENPATGEFLEGYFDS